MTRVPLSDLRRQYEPFRQSLLKEWDRLVHEGNFILGPDVEGFEKDIALACESKYALGVTSGTDALFLAIKALELPTGSRILTPPFTFFGTISAMVNAGMVPAFADVRADDFNLDMDAVERVLAEDKGKTIRAIMVVHLFGQPADMGRLMQLAKQYQLPVIEDAAQAIGARFAGKQVGSFGEVGCFSFYPSKNLGAMGDAGLCTLQSEEILSRLKSLRNHGSDVRYYHDRIGGNFRIDVMQAVALRLFLPHLNAWTERRREIAAAYDAAFAKLSDIIVAPPVLADRTHIYHQYTVRVRNGKRDALHYSLKEQGVASAIYYPVPCHLQKALASCGHRVGDYPVAEQTSHEVLSLPIFPSMTASEQGVVVESILNWVKFQ